MPRWPPTRPGSSAGWRCAAASPGSSRAGRRGPASVDRSEPSFDPFGEHEEQHADQDHETDRRIGAGQVVALGELVDELAEAAEIDQELDPHDVDEREDHAELDADEDR